MAVQGQETGCAVRWSGYKRLYCPSFVALELHAGLLVVVLGYGRLRGKSRYFKYTLTPKKIPKVGENAPKTHPTTATTTYDHI
jgi:hypothetical protein